MSFSKDPATELQNALQKNYTRLRFQQGKPVLDRELNLLGDLASPNRLAEQYLGNGVPVGSDGFRITNLNVGNNDFQIGAGRCLVGGHEVLLAASTTYKNQPISANVAALPAGASNVYLRVFLSPVTEADDPSLNNAGPGDVGSVTSVREKVSWEVLLSAAPINTRDHFLLAVINTALNSLTERRRVGLTVSGLSDEISSARGSALALDTRLGASLAPDGTLKANVVGAAQLVDGTVGTNELTDGGVSTTKLADASVNTAKLADGSVTTAKLANQAVPIAKLAATLVADTSISLPASPGVGQFSETPVNIDSTDGPAFHLISVRYVGPRPALPIFANFSSFFNWTRRTQLAKPPGQVLFSHRHQILFQNSMNSAITVAYKVYRLAES